MTIKDGNRVSIIEARKDMLKDDTSVACCLNS